jgi:hypothetical protein
MVNRRNFLFATANVLACSSIARAADDTWQSMLTDAFKADNSALLGRLIPPKDSPLWPLAQTQLDMAAREKIPYKIARYFVTSLSPEFRTAWPEPNPAHPTLANPVIVLFFLATKTEPSGDKTPWCAAFMNWCLRNASPCVQGNR